MTIEEINILIEKAKTRNNGVYSYRGYLWAVHNNKFVAFANYLGECYQRAGSFNILIGKVEDYKRKEKLIEWLKQQL